MRSHTESRIPIGRKGVLKARPGFYLYVGSAHGPGGLKARVGHHLGAASRPRWHVDHLRRILPVEAVWFAADPRRLEHAWARVLDEMEETSSPMRGFGSSDCRCTSHLFFTESRPSADRFRNRAGDLAKALKVQQGLPLLPVGMSDP